MDERSVDQERLCESLCPLIPHLDVIQLELPQRRIASEGVGDGGAAFILDTVLVQVERPNG